MKQILATIQTVPVANAAPVAPVNYFIEENQVKNFLEKFGGKNRVIIFALVERFNVNENGCE